MRDIKTATKEKDVVKNKVFSENPGCSSALTVFSENLGCSLGQERNRRKKGVTKQQQKTIRHQVRNLQYRAVQFGSLQKTK